MLFIYTYLKRCYNKKLISSTNSREWKHYSLQATKQKQGKLVRKLTVTALNQQVIFNSSNSQLWFFHKKKNLFKTT